MTTIATLTKVKDCKLTELCDKSIKNPEKSVFVDREPEIFKHLLAYLRTDRKYLPTNFISEDLKKQIEFELRYWKITKLDYHHATSPILQEVEQILNTTPEMYEQASKTPLDKWKSLGPLSIKEVIDKSEIDPQDLNLEEQEIKKNQFKPGCSHGMFVKGTNVVNGICRVIYKDGTIQEGMYVQAKRHGFMRIFYPDGNFFVGMYRDRTRQGPGRCVYADGRVEEGVWENGNFKN